VLLPDGLTLLLPSNVWISF